MLYVPKVALIHGDELRRIVHNYGNELKNAISLPLGSALEPGHNTRLGLRSLPFGSYGFAITNGDRITDRYLFADKILTGTYASEGQGRIVIYTPTQLQEITDAIEATNQKFADRGVQFTIERMIEAEGAKPVNIGLEGVGATL